MKTLLPHNNHSVLINVCRTRWVYRTDGMDRIVELLWPVHSTLEDIYLNRGVDGNWNHTSRNDAQALLNAITFPFIIIPTSYESQHRNMVHCPENHSEYGCQNPENAGIPD